MFSVWILFLRMRTNKSETCCRIRKSGSRTQKCPRMTTKDTRNVCIRRSLSTVETYRLSDGRSLGSGLQTTSRLIRFRRHVEYAHLAVVLSMKRGCDNAAKVCWRHTVKWKKILGAKIYCNKNFFVENERKMKNWFCNTNSSQFIKCKRRNFIMSCFIA